MISKLRKRSGVAKTHTDHDIDDSRVIATGREGKRCPFSKLSALAVLALAVGLTTGVANAEPAEGSDLSKVYQLPWCERAGVKRFNAPGIAGLQADYVERQLKNFFNIYRGYAYGDVGGHRMRPMARMLKVGQSTEMSPEMMKSVSEYIASMPTVAPKETLVNGDSDRGSVIYAKICKSCHGADAGGMAGLGPDLRYSGDWYLLTQLKNFKEKRRAGRDLKECSGLVPEQCDPQGMSMVKKVWPAKEPNKFLPDEQSMKDVIAYIMRLARNSRGNREEKHHG